MSPLDLLRRVRRNSPADPVVASDDDTDILQARIAELEQQVADAQEPTVAQLLAQVESAIQAAAKEAADAALRGEQPAVEVASARHALLISDRDTLRARQAEEDRSAQRVRIAQQAEGLYAETVEQLDTVVGEYKSALAQLPGLLEKLQWAYDTVGDAPAKVTTIVNNHSTRAAGLRAAASTAGMQLEMKPLAEPRLASPALNWDRVDHVSKAGTVLLVMIGNRFPLWAAQFGLSAQKARRTA